MTDTDETLDFEVIGREEAQRKAAAVDADLVRHIVRGHVGDMVHYYGPNLTREVLRERWGDRLDELYPVGLFAEEGEEEAPPAKPRAKVVRQRKSAPAAATSGPQAE